MASATGSEQANGTSTSTSASASASTAPSASTTTTTTKEETPFTTAALQADFDFWKEYIASRPSPDDAFFDFIDAYHTVHSDGQRNLAHDAGTGPGNSALRLARHYAHVVGSDVNGGALAAGRAMVPPELAGRVEYVASKAEDLDQHTAAGTADLVTAGECLPLLDVPVALRQFHRLLRPGGTLAAYFYGRPVFADGANAATCDALYEKAASRTGQFNWPLGGGAGPGRDFFHRAAEGLNSCLDSITFPAEDWTSVVRRKWNTDHLVLLCGQEGFDFPLPTADRRLPSDQTVEVIDRSFWADVWDIDRVRNYLLSLYPNVRARAGDKFHELEDILTDLNAAMGGPRNVTFSVVLVLATKK